VRRGRKRAAGPPAPPDPEALAVRPVRTAEWSETVPEEGAAGGPAEPRVVVERPLPPVRSISGLLQRISALTGVRRLRLDPLGSSVWRRMDGSRTVGELAAELRGSDATGAVGETAPGELEARVVRFVALLRREGLVGLPGLDDARIEVWRGRGGARPDPSAGNPPA